MRKPFMNEGEPMSTAQMLETLGGVADLLREAVEGEVVIDSKRAAVLLAGVEACSRELAERWEKE